MDNTTITDPFADLATGSAAKQGPPAATAKQIAFMTKLLDEKDHGFDTEAIASMLTQSRKAVSSHIDFLMSRPRKATPNSSAGIVLKEGIYKKDNDFFKVYMTRTSRQQVVGKLHLTLREDGSLLTADWEYLGKAGLLLLTPEDKCTQDEAAAFGSMYGCCCNCLALLNDPISIHCGYGPVCADNNGWWRPTPGEYARILEAQGLEVAQ